MVLRTGIILLLVVAFAGPLRAQAVLKDAKWLAPEATPAKALTAVPRPGLSEPADPDLALLGELAFRSTDLFGPDARRAGLACNTCHTGGHANTRFFLEGASDRPGNFDPTTAIFHDRDDGIGNAINLPSLWGARRTAPYGRMGKFRTLADFTRHVIVDEFGGKEPPPWLLKALVAYQTQLNFPPNPYLTPGGRLTDAATPAMRRGEMVFNRSPSADIVASCAACHPPQRGFTDGQRHDVGTGGRFVTPTLRGLARTAPYLHDGSAADLPAVLDAMSRWLKVELSARDQADLIAYLEAVGADEAPRGTPTVAEDIDRVRRFAGLMERALERGDDKRSDWISRQVRAEIGHIHDRFPGPDLSQSRRVLIGWSRALQQVAGTATAGDFAAAGAELDAWFKRVDAESSKLAEAAPRSLYNPDLLKTYKPRPL